MGVTYQIIRGIVFIVVLLIFLLLRLCFRSFFNSRKRRRNLAIISVFIAVSAVLLSMMYPIDNLFYSFKTPEEAFVYVSQVEPENVITGQASCIVSGKHGNDYVPDGIFTKAEDGWKLGKASDLKYCFSIIPSKEFDITVSRYKDSEDYYVRVTDYTGIDREITDKFGSTFIKWHENGNECTYKTYVQGFDMDYYIVIDGRMIQMER